MQLRINRGLTRQQVSDASGINVRVVERVENRDARKVYWGTINQILTKGIGVKIELTFGGGGDEGPEEGLLLSPMPGDTV